MKYKFLISGIVTSAMIVFAMIVWGWIIGGNKELVDQVGQIVFAFIVIFIPFVYIFFRVAISLITLIGTVILTFVYWIPIILIGFRVMPDASIGLGLAILVSPLFIVIAVLVFERVFVSNGRYRKWKHKLFPPHSTPNSNR